MDRYRKAVVAGIAGAIGALGVAVAVTADNAVSLNDWCAIAFAGATAIGQTIGVAVVRNGE
jgi:hypothetical protein